MPSVMLSDCVDRFLAWAQLNLAPRTVDGYRLYLHRFLKWAGNVPADSLSPAMLQTWAKTFHPCQAVQRLTGWLHKEERSLAINPLAGMRKIPTGMRRRVFTRREAVTLLRRTDATFRAFLMAMRESIARPQETRAVTAAHIRQAGGLAASRGAILAGRAFFLMDRAKGFERRADQSKVRIIPISPRLGRLILRLIDATEGRNGPLFRDSRGMAWTANAVRCRFRRLRSAAGMIADARGERVVPYTFRHTGATAAAAAGLRDWLLAEVLGHSTPRTTARYVHLQAADVVDAMQRIWELKPGRSAKNDRPRSLRKRPEA